MFWKSLKLEWRKMWTGKKLIYAVLVGCVISIFQIIVEDVPQLKGLAGHAVMEYPDSVFNKGLMFEFSKYMVAYYTAVSFIAVIPYSLSFYREKQSGYIRQIITRMDSKQYFIAKYIVTFLSGGIAVTVPLLMNLMISTAIWPSVVPQPGTMTFPIFGTSMFSDLFFSMPYLYALIYLMIDFAIAGILATFSLGISWIAFHKYIVLFFPFIVYYLIHFICTYIGNQKLSPLAIMMPQQQNTDMSYFVTGMVIALLFVASLLMYWIGGKKNEVY